MPENAIFVFFMLLLLLFLLAFASLACFSDALASQIELAEHVARHFILTFLHERHVNIKAVTIEVERDRCLLLVHLLDRKSVV